MADQTSEKTLASTISSSDQLQPTDSVSTETASSGSLSRNSSFSKLSALAPEFIPRKTTPPPTPLNAGDPMVMIVPPPPPPPPAMVHVFPPQVNSPFPAMPLPHIDHHHQQQHHHHQQQQHYPHQNHHSHHHRNDSHRNHHHKNHHQQQQLHGGNNGEQKEGVGQGSNQQYKDQGQGSNGGSRNKNGLSEESTQKLINQVEYYFSDLNLATTDHLIKFINKDPEGFVPISVVASFKKIKALISSNSQLAAVLKKSTKLIVNEDGKKVKRVHPLTGSDMEELQSRIIVAENLPEDHCHQNLMKVFSTVGSVKSIRTCQPQPTNNVASSASRPSKADNGLSCNKVHAFVEYESVELAEKAIAELNEEDDWRNGLKIRPLLKHGSKTVQVRGKKSVNEGEGTCEEYASTSEQKQNEKQSEDFLGQPDIHSQEHSEEPNVEKEGGQKKGRNRGRGKGRGRGHHNHQQNNRAHHVGSPPVNNAINGEHPIVAKQQPPGPRMPDGTRGFSMGRGKPAAVNST